MSIENPDPPKTEAAEVMASEYKRLREIEREFKILSAPPNVTTEEAERLRAVELEYLKLRVRCEDLFDCRDQFAAAALTGYASQSEVTSPAKVAAWAYADADAMMAERAKANG